MVVGDFDLVAGRPREYPSSPGVRRSFCGRCGTPLTYWHVERPAEVDVTIASLDAPALATHTARDLRARAQCRLRGTQPEQRPATTGRIVNQQRRRETPAGARPAQGFDLWRKPEQIRWRWRGVHRSANAASAAASTWSAEALASMRRIRSGSRAARSR